MSDSVTVDNMLASLTQLQELNDKSQGTVADLSKAVAGLVDLAKAMAPKAQAPAQEPDGDEAGGGAAGGHAEPDGDEPDEDDDEEQDGDEPGYEDMLKKAMENADGEFIDAGEVLTAVGTEIRKMRSMKRLIKAQDAKIAALTEMVSGLARTMAAGNAVLVPLAKAVAETQIAVGGIPASPYREPAQAGRPVVSPRRAPAQLTPDEALANLSKADLDTRLFKAMSAGVLEPLEVQFIQRNRTLPAEHADRAAKLSAISAG